MIVRFWGVRGSLPAPGPHTLHFGGNTSCVEVRCGDQLLILDGGTGLRPLGDSLQREGIRHGIMLFSHVHWDHIQGFPFFAPAYDPYGSFEILAGEDLLQSLEEVLRRQMRPPNFPIRLGEMGASFTFRPIRRNEPCVSGEVEIQSLELKHPDQNYGFKIRYHDTTIVYATDTEHASNGTDHRFTEFCRNADLLIHDAQFTEEEYEGVKDGRPKRGWGHSSAQGAARIALGSKVARLALFHHDPSHDDETMRGMELEARTIFPGTVAAFEGLELDLGDGES
jgi:phosphoribosyl 1,2-cyclic phosphodiesterase